MYSVSNDYKTTARLEAKQVVARVTDGTTVITGADDLKSIKIRADGGLCRTVLRQAEVKVWGTHDWTDKTVKLEAGLVVGVTPTYIDYGIFKVVEVKEDKATDVRTLKLFDKMYEALLPYEEMIEDYPMTIKELLDAICLKLGWTLATTVFTHSTLSIAGEIFNNQKLSYRDVLEDIAEATGTIILFNEDDELELRAVDTDTSVDTITSNDLIELTVGESWGELNSLALAREPQEDVIVEKDDISISANGLWEFRIVNNLILDLDREAYIGDLFTALNGIEYKSFDCKTVGFGYFEIGDVITVTDKASVNHKVLITSLQVDLTAGFNDVLKGEHPDKSSTNYNTAGIIGKRITSTEIIVNKQEGEIQLLNSAMETVATIPRQATAPENPEVNDLWLNTMDNVVYIFNGEEWVATSVTIADLDNYYTKGETNAEINMVADAIQLSVEELETRVSGAEVSIDENGDEILDIKSSITTLELKADGLEIDVSQVGGSNLLKNSAGLKGSIEEWQVFDVDGNLLDADNDGTTVTTSSVKENTESGSGIRIEEQYIVQVVPTIVGMPYTFYCRFNKLLGLDLNITGVAGTLSITAGDYVDETWAIYQYQFTANSDLTEVKIGNTGSGVGAYAILSDMVLKAGIVSGWVQAPNEVYGQNYRFDKDGFSVTSPTDNFKALLDNTKLAMYDTTGGTDRTLALFSKDAGLITSLVAQDEFVVQRYENSDKSVRFIPTSTGCMVTVND